jgi:hypothetical protein
MEQIWKIVVSGTSEPVEGCESLTIEQAMEWLDTRQEIYPDEPNIFGDSQKYILIPIESAE